MVVNAIQIMTGSWATLVHSSDSLAVLFSKLPMWSFVLAQQVSDPNLIGQAQKAWSYFIQSGQIWALIVGAIVGYFIRGMV
ncbi:hypothetical protein H6S82_08455 [Planktothrix sp. FACHB-1355]|uniref:Uncharacterized protein n=1 Tax=Aerosakkonema funiforme FACHB-1375 TaxID=2949571 RepID=A0A926VEF3_9CYAN|nr:MULTISPECIES: hypothetical protein [Oscillatoriales]MBD2182218.1 hypothetical protein [Aerosakkonema funiforme FACHB-1375]MBD3558888.1 hypothetical protein [Planktothrix sp. FACHB-1355]